MSREQAASNGIRRWLHPVTKSSEQDEHRAHLTARHVKELQVDASLLKGGAKNYGTHRIRRKDLPSHVPPSWLLPQPSTGRLSQHDLGKQGEEGFVIKAGRHSGHAQRPARYASSKSQSRTAEGSGQFDSTYSYVFPPGGSHRLELAAKHSSSQKSGEVSSAPVGHLDQARLLEPDSSSTEPSAETFAELSAKKNGLDNRETACACSVAEVQNIQHHRLSALADAHESARVLCSPETAQHQSSSSPDSFAFPDLPGAVCSSASMPLKQAPQLPAGACSTPGPLEESLLRCSASTTSSVRPDGRMPSSSHTLALRRHQGNEAGPGQSLSPECAQQPSISSQPIIMPCGGQLGISSSRHGSGRPRHFDCRDQEAIPCTSTNEPGPETCDAHSVCKAASTAKSCEPASAEKLGPNFERLVASFQNRKAQQPSGHSGRTYSNPVYTASTLSDSLQALKARSAGATSSHSRCPSEDTMTSTAATERPRSPAMLGMPAQPQYNTAGAGHHVMSRALAGCTKHGHQVGPVSRLHGDQRSAAGKAAKHAASPTEQQHGYQSAQAPQLTDAAAAALSEQAARKHVGSHIPHVGRAAMGPAEMGMHATQAPPRWATAASLVTPADISAEATEQAISRQLWAILGILCAAAALFLACIVLLSWRLLVFARHPNAPGEPPAEGSDYAWLTPAWWPS